MTKPADATISRGAYQVFVGNVASTAILAITAIIVGRLLGPAQYGLYTIALVLPSFVYLIIGLGLPSALVRHVAKHSSEGLQEKALSFSSSIMIFGLLLAILSVVLVAPFSSLIARSLLNRPDLTGIIVPIAMLSVIGQVLFMNSTSTLQGLNRFERSALFQVIQAIVKLAVSVFLVLVGYSVVGAVAGYTAGFLVAGAMSFILLISMNKRLVPINWSKDINTALKYSAPVYSASLVAGFLSPFQSTILANTVSNAEIGWYAAAVNIVAIIGLFTFPVTTVLFPLFSRTSRGQVSQFAETYRVSVKYSALLITPITLFVMSFSAPVAGIVFGHAYLSTGSYLWILASVNLLAGLGAISWSPFLNGIGETRKAFLASAIGSILSILASAFLAYRYGVYGVIFGTIIGQTVSLLLASKMISDMMGGFRVWFAWRIYLASAISALAVYPISLTGLNSILIVVSGAALFFLVLVPVMVWTRAMTRNDMNALQVQFGDVGLVRRLINLVRIYYDLFASA